MTDPCDLIKRLAKELDLYRQMARDNCTSTHPLADEARAYLAQPEPEGPTDEELLALMPESMRDEFSYAAKVASDATGGQAKPGIFRICLNHSALEYARAVLARWGRPAAEPEGTITEPSSCPTPGACSCPTAPYVPPELIRALELAEAALADIGDAEREPGDDLAWAESRAARELPRIRAVLARWGK